MSPADTPGPNREAEPERERAEAPGLAFSIIAPPLAWLVQVSAGEMLTSWPCFPSMHRRNAPLDGYGWSHPAALVVMLASAAVAALGGWLAWRALRRAMTEEGGDHAELAEVGHGRVRFVALWGTIIGVGFAIASLVTLVAFAMVPRCLG